MIEISFHDRKCLSDFLLKPAKLVASFVVAFPFFKGFKLF